MYEREWEFLAKGKQAILDYVQDTGVRNAKAALRELIGGGRPGFQSERLALKATLRGGGLKFSMSVRPGSHPSQTLG